MTSCSQQLRSLLKEESVISRTNKATPRPILPLKPEDGEKFVRESFPFHGINADAMIIV